MNDFLVIYDNTGFIISQMQGSDLRQPIGIPFIHVTIPENKILIRIDTTGEEHIPVFEDMPKLMTQLLQERIDLMQSALDDLILGGAL